MQARDTMLLLQFWRVRHHSHLLLKMVIYEYNDTPFLGPFEFQDLRTSQPSADATELFFHQKLFLALSATS